MHKRLTYTLDEIPRMAKSVASILDDGAVLGFSGPLGAGKTTWIKALAKEMGVDPEEVTSPTYVYHHMYPGTQTVHHIDLYRVENEQALLQLDLVGAIEGDGVALIEWMERFPHAFGPHVHFRLEDHGAQERTLSWSFHDLDEPTIAKWKQVLEAL